MAIKITRKEGENTFEEPSVTVEKDRTIYRHPAYGVISRCSSQGSHALFGSDTTHHHAIHFEVKGAYLDRHLGTDWIHGRETVVDFYMSQADFAQLIADSNGKAIPITFRHRMKGGEFVHLPQIKPVETKRELLRKEIEETVRKQLDKAITAAEALREAIETKKGVSVTRPLVSTLMMVLGSLPSNLKFSVGTAYEAIDEATEDAYHDLKVTLAQDIQNLGVDGALSNLLGLASPDTSVNNEPDAIDGEP